MSEGVRCVSPVGEHVSTTTISSVSVSNSTTVWTQGLPFVLVCSPDVTVTVSHSGTSSSVLLLKLHPIQGGLYLNHYTMVWVPEDTCGEL